MSKKRIISLIVIGVLLSSMSVLATYLIESSDVEFDNTTANIPDANGDETVSVQEAIDYLINNMSGGASYTVTFDTDGAGTISDEVVSSKALAALSTTPVKEGYSFVGWYTEAAGGTRVTSTTEITADTDLYAHYTVQNFSTDSWETIATNVRAGNTSGYHVGDTKTVTLEGTGDLGGTYVVRVSNNSHYDCKVEDSDDEMSSKTACGFVVEFEDIITKYRMQYVYNGTKYLSGAYGGWPVTNLRGWLNTTLLYYFPSDLKNVIVDTTVVSSKLDSCYSDICTTVSIEKLYLLSTAEVILGGISSDRARDKTITRQLDYYGDDSVTTSRTNKNIKNYSNTATTWWLRSSSQGNSDYFRAIDSSGASYGTSSSGQLGVSPAFRIG